MTEQKKFHFLYISLCQRTLWCVVFYTDPQQPTQTNEPPYMVQWLPLPFPHVTCNERALCHFPPPQFPSRQAHSVPILRKELDSLREGITAPTAQPDDAIVHPLQAREIEVTALSSFGSSKSCSVPLHRLSRMMFSSRAPHWTTCSVHTCQPGYRWRRAFCPTFSDFLLSRATWWGCPLFSAWMRISASATISEVRKFCFLPSTRPFPKTHSNCTPSDPSAPEAVINLHDVMEQRLGL